MGENNMSLVGVVRCRYCSRRGTMACPMRFEELLEWDNEDHDWEVVVHDNTVDDGYCNYGEMKEGDE